MAEKGNCPICKQEFELEECPGCLDRRFYGEPVDPDPNCKVCHGTGMFGVCDQIHTEEEIAIFRKGIVYWKLYELRCWLRLVWHYMLHPVEFCPDCKKINRIGSKEVGGHDDCPSTFPF